MENINTLSVAELRSRHKEITESSKQQLADIMDALAAKCGTELARIFQNKDKTSGDVSAEFDGVKVQLSVSKEVKWNDAKLKEAAALIPADKVNAIFVAKLTVPEKVYSVLSTLLDAENPALAKINEARLVKIGEPKIAFAKE